MEKNIFFRRVENLGELQLALTELSKECGARPSEIPFNAAVRLDLTDTSLILTILKRH